MGSEQLGEFQSNEKLISPSLQEVTAISLASPDKEPLEIMKVDSAWTLPGSLNHPASEEKIKTLITDLEGLTRPYPAGNTLLAANTLETADNKYKQKLTLSRKDGEPITVYFGTSPGFKKVYARLSGEEKTYSVPFASHNLQSDATFWLDKDYASLKKSDIVSLAFKDFTLDFSEKPAILTPTPDGKVLDENKANQLLSNATKIRFTELLGDKNEPTYHMDKPDVTYTVKTIQDKELTYTFGFPDKADYYVMKRSDLPYYYKVLKYQVDKLTTANVESLIKDKPEALEEETTQSTEGNPDQSQDETLPSSADQP